MRKGYRDSIRAEVTTARDIADAAAKADRDLTDVERDTIEEHMAKAMKMEETAKAEAALHAKMANLTATLGLGTGDDDEAPGGTGPADPGNEPAGGRKASIAERFITGPEYKAMIAGTPNGQFSEKMRVHSAPMAVDGMKDLFYSGNRTQSAGVLLNNDFRGLLDPFYERPLTIRELFASGTTDSDVIEYVKWLSTTNNAAVVPEARSTDPIGTGAGTTTAALGGLKPQSAFTFGRDTANVRTIAHWIPATKRALSDAAQIRTMIDSFLRYGLEEELEDQLLTGTGSGENFLGLNNVPGIQTQGAVTGRDNMDLLRIARRKVKIGGRANATAYAMNPIDWENIELTRDGDGRFYGAGPFSLTTPSIWGLPVVESEAVTPGTAWCAAWNWGVVYDREQASVQATDSHADFFTRNMVAILAEMRAAFAVLRPPAFVKVTLAP